MKNSLCHKNVTLYYTQYKITKSYHHINGHQTVAMGFYTLAK
ncbi:hypothetical protein HNR44_001658 [Geomicrobium halophilum]|uniref:Uncharacterized protein n=1 Tax=Geomicrobium halophilum TaxID=549000 RepID=A0A841PLP0_9BACL|nr:hypothetical protein [Geomicrobium halophilum]